MFKTAFVIPAAVVTTLALASTAQALETHNGLAFNGLAFNGLAFNGLAFNGLAFNGLAFNGVEADGVMRREATDAAPAVKATTIILQNGEHISLK